MRFMPICFNMGKMDAEYDMTHFVSTIWLE